ncbi:predicted protein [Nematostella vectensis]|uniref:RING-type E3 ubiquitin transferase n=1 Tax=Nematostella vectensis TaxID=45351 RepID=A7S7Q5_NEMVE|nr:predicted protein [Nematostella vectensis]|eukprot:XP_001632340.1 predicted protein [Nematostella vectensis]
MEGELTCPICLELFQRPVVLPCSHNLCTRCARRILEPRGSSKAWADWVTENKGPNYKSHLEPDVKCPSCRRKIPVDPRGVDALPRNLILENVIERFKEERAVPGRQAQQPVLCQFCEDVAPQTATCTCKQCGFSYCGTCFDACHPMKGPLASHTLGPPDDKAPKPKNTSNMMCPDHPHERMALYCYGCRSAVCYLCKEAGSHRAHHVELLEKVFRKTKVRVTRSLGTLMRRNTATQKLVDTLEGMCAVAKKSGNDVESHVKKECDALLAIVEKKKAELLDNVNSEYNEKLAELHETILECDKTLQQSLGLVEFSQEALKEDNPVTFLQQMMNVYLNGKLQTPDTRPGGPSFAGVSGTFSPALSVYGTSAQMTLIPGLQSPSTPPGIPVINLEDCSIDNTKISFAWVPPEQCNVDCYIMEVDILDREGDIHQERTFTKVYQGPRNKFTLRGLEYNVTVVARVKAVNTAGEGEPSEEISLSTEKGLYFQLDPSTANHELEMSPDDCTVALKSPMYTFILGNVKLSSGRHYWRVHVDEFSSPNQLSIIGVGIARGIIDDPILGEDSHSYAVQINEHPTTTCINTKNRIQIKRSSAEMTNSNVGVLLNLDDHLLNIYFNGKSVPNGPTFHGITQAFYPALSLYGMNVKLTVHTGEAFDT